MRRFSGEFFFDLSLLAFLLRRIRSRISFGTSGELRCGLEMVEHLVANDRDEFSAVSSAAAARSRDWQSVMVVVGQFDVRWSAYFL